MNFDEALRYLLSLGHETVAIKLGLANIEHLLKALGRPHTSFPAVQIAGTNGKGSTAVVLDSICRAAHIRTGLYTSPHLVSITERIRIGGLEITRREFARLITDVRDAAQYLLDRGELGALPTFFEHVTAAALLAFSRQDVRLAILETGLGGRLDATTAALAQTVALTPVALDHQEYLGHSLSEIAAEKAAIIRPGVTAIVAPQPPESLAVILKQCALNDVVPRFVDDAHIRVIGAEESGHLRISLKTETDFYQNVRVGLRGRHQLTNVAVAVRLSEALRESGFVITHEAIVEGIEKARHRGRLERRKGEPSLLFDGAHNAAGASALRAYLDEFERDASITLLFGAMRDKALAEIGATLFPAASRLIFTQPQSPRSAAPEEIARVAVSSGIDSSRITLVHSTAEALRIAVEQTPPRRGLILITGSLYLIGEIQRLLEEQEQASHPF